VSDEELIASLRGKGFSFMEKAADRIEALTAERDAWKEQHDAEALGLHVQMQRAEAAEAKLAKLVSIAKRITSFEDTTEELAECGCARCKAHLDLRATLAEIEGSDAP
jgi:hypothetical protein